LYQEVGQLFSSCFNENLDYKHWKEFFLGSPFGSSVGVSGYVDGTLVGFYGLIPQRLMRQASKDLEYFLGVSLMIHPDHRGTAFFDLLEAAFATARRTSSLFILGFPNANSYLPLVRLLNWRLLLETEFFEIDILRPSSMVNSNNDVNTHLISIQNTSSQWGVPYQDEAYMKWRSYRNAYSIVPLVMGCDVVYKIIEPNTLDMMDVRIGATQEITLGSLLKLALQNNCDKIVLTGYHADILGVDKSFLKPRSEYRLRLCVFPIREMVPPIHLSLLMSDVF